MTVKEFIEELQTNFAGDLDAPLYFIYREWAEDTPNVYFSSDEEDDSYYLGFDLDLEELESTMWTENGKECVECHVCFSKKEED